MELTCFHWPNVGSFKVISDVKRTPLVGECLPPSTLEHLPDLEEDLARFRDQYPIVIGDLNTDIGQNPCSQQVTGLLMELVLVDIIRHFFQLLRFLHLNMWSQVS